MWARLVILGRIVIIIVEELHKSLVNPKDNNNLKIILSIRILKSNRFKINMLDSSNIIKINSMAQSNKNKKDIIIKSATVCNLPRVILLNSKDKLHLDSNMFNK